MEIEAKVMKLPHIKAYLIPKPVHLTHSHL